MPAHSGQSARMRKRDSASQPKEQGSESASKKRKTSSSDYPPRFWDTISVVQLTRRALKEFDRRIAAVERGETRAAASTTPRLLRCDARRLTESAKAGGPDLSSLRGYADRAPVTATMSQSSPQGQKRSHDSSASRSLAIGRTRKTTPCSAEFQQKLIDQGVYPEGYRQEDGSRAPQPNNADEIKRELCQPRASLSPSAFPETAFQDFRDRNRAATSESKVMATVIPIIIGSQDAQHHSGWGIPFNGLQKFDKDVSVPSPDIYYGARPDQIDRRVRQDLGQYIVPSSDQSQPAAPNYFLEAKSVEGRPDVALRQATQNGGHGARSLFELQNYGNATPTYDGNAYTLSLTYLDGQLQIYATHPRPSATRPGETDYHMTHLDSYAMTGNANCFREGAAAYRNGRDWAKRQRDRLIANANAAARRMSAETRSSSMMDSTRRPPTTVTDTTSRDTSEDEPASQYGTNAK